MNYHNIQKDDMLNGEGIRVTLFVSGCEHKCPGCHNPETWCVDSGIEFDEAAKQEIFDELEKDYVQGVTFSGGDPFHPHNINTVLDLIIEIRNKYPRKDVWVYTGYETDEVLKQGTILPLLIDGDIAKIVTGKFREDLLSPDLPWVGSSNQTLVDASFDKK